MIVKVSPESVHLIDEAAELLGLWPVDLRESLLVRSITVRGDTMYTGFTLSEAADARNALAKEIYGRLFSHIVWQANASLKPTGTGSSSDKTGELMSIGLLDIFGFEKFKMNSFEQLCINYCNEKLQQYFINYILKKEHELYFNEGIEELSSSVIPIDNT